MCLQYYNDSNDNELYSKRHSLYTLCLFPKRYTTQNMFEAKIQII